MNHLCNVLRISTALFLTTLALPSFATDPNWFREYDLDMTIASAPPAQPNPPFTVTAKIKNTGLLPIGSFTLSVTGMTIVGVSRPSNGFLVSSFPGSSASVTFLRPLFWSQSLTLTLQVSSCGSGAWNTVAYLGEFLNGPTLELNAGDSALQTSITCASVPSGAPFTVPDSLASSACVALQGGSVAGERGYYDKNGSVPAGTLPIVVTNTIPTNDQLHFSWPDFETGGDALATWQYSVCGPGALPTLTDVAWLNVDGTPASTPGTPAYITAEDCLADANFLPAPYGTLTGSFITYVDTSYNAPITLIPIDTTTPPAQKLPGTPPGSVPYPGSPPTDPAIPGTPFDVVIDTERITVQLVCLDNDSDPTDTADCSEYDEGEGEALMVVQRGVGGTAVATHVAGALVMSTPLPLLSTDATKVLAPYTPGNQALMCISSQIGEATQGPDSGVHSTTFMDIGGDGWANHP